MPLFELEVLQVCQVSAIYHVEADDEEDAKAQYNIGNACHYDDTETDILSTLDIKAKEIGYA